MADTNVSKRSLLAGAGTGVGAYLLGYLVTYLHAAGAVRRSLAGRLLEFVTGEPATWKMVGWVFYNAHFVKTLVPGPFGENAVDFVARFDAISSGLYLLPIVVLLAAGAVGAVLGGAPELREGAVAGVATTLGYFPLAIVGAFFFRISLGDATAGPSLVTAVLLAGLVYPLVFGGVGGAAIGTGR